MEPVRKVEEDRPEERNLVHERNLVEERHLVEAKGDRRGQPGQQYFRSR